jgi:hypothetical protein
MAGVFDDINNRADFFRELAKATAQVKVVLAQNPHDDTFQAVLTQLEAIARWTANGRTPTDEERGKIGMSLRLHREYEVTDDLEIQKLKNLITPLNNYFRYWPDDTTAGDPNNFDVLKYRRI